MSPLARQPPPLQDEAQRLGVALVIVGMRRHGRVDRTFNNETALNVMRNAPAPCSALFQE